MPGYLANVGTTPLADVSGTAFSHLEVKYLVSEENSDAELTFLGQTIYPAGGPPTRLTITRMRRRRSSSSPAPGAIASGTNGSILPPETSSLFRRDRFTRPSPATTRTS